MTGISVVCARSAWWIDVYQKSNTRFVSSGRAGKREVSIRTPVVIVGGGPTGLLLSNLLSLYGTPSVLLEGEMPEQRFAHPQAHFLNTRTMEILRHSLPSVYKEVWKKVPPVNNWNHFQWGSSMTSAIARVRHPVDSPLKANVDANGRLLQSSDFDSGISNRAESEKGSNHPLSVCSVAHLAQHHFCRILWKAAKRNADNDTMVEYGVFVTRVEQDDKDPSFPVTVTTHQGQTIHTKYVVAADGSSSSLRKAWNIGLQGQRDMQHLVNIHINISEELSNTLHTPENAAMLHFIYHPSVIAVVVCHSVGEYVLQVPSFPPFQTLDHDFSLEKVRSMVEAALGIPEDTTTTNEDLEIVSIRPWTMSSLVAERYVSGNRCVLAGDSAHVFPPAGGFGMNTGLQDVHNLAWRLSWLHDNGSENDNKPQLAGQVFDRYEQERRAVARKNAALSVRNFNRTLQLAKGCYLNNQHPLALTSMLSSPPLSFLSLKARQDMFQTLVQTALRPLSALQDKESIHGQRVSRNVRNILGRGGGLPLLFPKYELGYCYWNKQDKREENVDNDDWSRDTLGYSPGLRVGCLFPHAVVKVLRPSPAVLMDQYPNLIQINEESKNDDVGVYMTTTDLPAQLRQGASYYSHGIGTTRIPAFVLLLFDCDPDVVNRVENCLPSLGVPVQAVQVEIERDPADVPASQSKALTLADIRTTLRPMMHQVGNKPMIILVRPDGHIASIIVLKRVTTQGGTKDTVSICDDTGVVECELAYAPEHLLDTVHKALGTQTAKA